MFCCYDTLAFDLDGTLTDSAPGIIDAVKYAIDRLGLPMLPDSELLKFVGPPLLNSFSEYCCLDEEHAALGCVYFRDRYIPYGMFNNSPYEGIAQLLKKLSDSGYRMYVVTSKPEHMAIEILKRFSLIGRFDGVYGAEMNEVRQHKEQILRKLIEQRGIAPNRLLMIGDRKYDAEAAKRNSADCLGVTYGYGSRQELEAAGARYIADSVEALCDMLV